MVGDSVHKSWKFVPFSSNRVLQNLSVI